MKMLSPPTGNVQPAAKKELERMLRGLEAKKPATGMQPEQPEQPTKPTKPKQNKNEIEIEERGFRAKGMQPEQRRQSEQRMQPMQLTKGKGMKKGGKVSSASSRADGCVVRGKTKGRMV